MFGCIVCSRNALENVLESVIEAPKQFGAKSLPPLFLVAGEQVFVWARFFF